MFDLDQCVEIGCGVFNRLCSQHIRNIISVGMSCSITLLVRSNMSVLYLDFVLLEDFRIVKKQQ